MDHKMNIDQGNRSSKSKGPIVCTEGFIGKMSGRLNLGPAIDQQTKLDGFLIDLKKLEIEKNAAAEETRQNVDNILQWTNRQTSNDTDRNNTIEAIRNPAHTVYDLVWYVRLSDASVHVLDIFQGRDDIAQDATKKFLESL